MQKQCDSCVYFVQHYAFDNRKIFRICCGHCVYARPKTKKPHAKACVNYQQRVFDEEVFVSKEYLSKELLEYILKLDLLPTIERTKEQP